MTTPVYFGVRHLSPAAAHHVRLELDRVKPDVVLIEGPSDLNEQMQWLCHAQTELPAAILACTGAGGESGCGYAYAVYSPENPCIHAKGACTHDSISLCGLFSRISGNFMGA